MRRQSSRLLSCLLLLALAAGCAGTPPAPPTPVAPISTSVPTANPAIGAVPALPYAPTALNQIAPTIIQRTPAPGAELAPDGAIELVFDRPMDQVSVGAALAMPGIAGTLAWPNAQTVRFTPNAPLERGRNYDLTLAAGAKAQDGATTSAPLQFQFPTSGFLEVAQVIPADGAADVTIDATITVLFNRPVVALTTFSQPGAQPQPPPNPLIFSPAIQGSGEWLSTAVYVFRPSAPLAGGTRYNATIAAGLSDTNGSPLQQAYSWSFNTARPQVLAVTPADGERLVPLENPLTVTFNQPIDPAAAQAAFSLRDPAGNGVAGAFQVLGATLTFTPAQRLAFDTNYQLAVSGSLSGQGGGAGLASDFRSSFRTVPLPQLIRTEPADGAQDVSPYSGFSLVFNAPINPDTVMPNIQITPPISPTQVYTFYSTLYNDPSGGSVFSINFGMQPSSDYRVQIGANIADPYGNTIGQARTVRFRTAQLPPSIYLVTPGTIATYNTVTPTRIGLRAINVPTANLTLWQIQASDLQRQNDWLYSGGPPGGAQQVRTWQQPLNLPQNDDRLLTINLAENGGPLPEGVYLLQLEQTAGPPQGQVLVVSNAILTLKAGMRDALIWATNSQSGQPLANLALDLFDEQGGALGSTTTDASGVALASFNRSENRGLLAIARQPLAVAAASWSGGISPWEFNLPVQFDYPDRTAFLYTDRPIYRPGQQVQFRGIVRTEDDATFSLPGIRSANVTVFSASGETIYQQEHQLSPNGSFAGSLTLDAGAALGGYTLSADLDGRAANASFQVAAYRPPEFEVMVTPQASEITRGAAPRASVQASYFFGGPVASVPVQWNVLALPYHFAPAGFDRYQFGDNDSPYICWECWWQPQPSPQIIQSGSGTSDAQGKLAINMPADFYTPAPTNGQQPTGSDPLLNGSVQLTIEATASGRDNQAISGRSNLIVHQGDLYLGLAAQSYLGKAGEPQTIELVTLDTQGKRLANQSATLEFFKITWENTFITDASGAGRWETSEKREPAGQQALTSDAQGSATASFTPAVGGSYRVVASSRDSGGRSVRSALFIWVADDAFVSWRRDNSDRITLISDRVRYKPGETADVLIPSPFQGPHWALITVERGKVLSHEVRQVNGNSLVYRLPLTAGHVPNVYVSVVLFSPAGAGKPADYKVGMLPLEIEPLPQSLNITLSPSPQQAGAGPGTALPGAPVSYTVQVNDTAGQPVAAELSLDLVDKAVLSLLPRQPNAIREAFYGRRGLGIITASGLTLAGERFLQQLDKAIKQQPAPPVADSAVAEAMPAPAAPAATAAPAAAQAPGAPSDGRSNAAGGMGSAAPAITIREEFADSAYWNPSIYSNAAGQASVQLKLPDNLTTWVMRGVGISSDTKVGEGLVELVANKPLLLRPVTPRFLVVGDSVELAANVSNTTSTALEAQVSLAAPQLQITTAATQTLQLAANSEATVRWQVLVGDIEAADLVFSAIAGQYTDASRPRLATRPNGGLAVYRYSAPEVVGTAGQLAAADSRTELITLPPLLDTKQGELTIRLDPSLAAGLRESLKALDDPEYKTTESIVSRFLPNLATARALTALKIANAELEAKLPALVTTDLNELYLLQRQDGGWGWWSPRQIDEPSNPYLSGYVVFAMLRAKQAGYAVRDESLGQGLTYLSTQLKPAGTTPTQWEASSAGLQTWLLYVLGEAEQGDPPRLADLYQARDKLSIEARCFLALALHKTNGPAGQIKTLLSDLNTAAIVSATGSHWEERSRNWWSMGSDTRSTALVIMTLSTLDAANQSIPNAVRWLMTARKLGVWESSQENAWAILALTDWMQLSGELDASYDYGAWLNDKPLAGGTITPADVQNPLVLKLPIAAPGSPVAAVLSGTPNRLVIGRGAGVGRLYYTAHLRAFLPVEAIGALDRGLSISRRYVAADCDKGLACPELSEVKLGDQIRVELSITSVADRYYLRVEDPLPAGAEAVDTSLATTAQLGQPSSPNGPQPVFERSPGREFLFGDWWWWPWYSRAELRDEKVALFADYLPRGSYLFSYTIRATTPGEFRVIPTTGSELYFPEVYGRSNGRLLNIVR